MVSITFTNPQYLWFLFAIPLLVVTHFFLLRHAKRRAMKFANFVALKRVTGERLITKNYMMLAVRIMIIACAIFAVSGTILWYEGITNENDYVIALDTSASMSTADIEPTRLDAAKEYALQFAQNLDGNTKIGLVSFSGVTFIEQTLTTNREDMKKSLEGMDIVAAGTDIPGAMITSTNLLANVEKGRAIVLITDGSNTIEDFNSKSIQRASNYAVINHVKVYTIGIGKDIKTPIGYLPNYYNVSASYNTDNLRLIANNTGGKFYEVQDEDQIAAAYNDIKASDKTSTIKLELTGGLMLVAMLLIMLEWGLLSTRFRSLP